METIKEAKEFLNANIEKGCACPCCEQHVKVYKRKINSGMALFLIGLYKLRSKEANSAVWSTNIAVMQKMGIVAKSLDYSILKHFGFIEDDCPDMGKAKDKRKSGYWRITEAGILFVEARRMTPSHVILYNNTMHGLTGKEIGIVGALGSKFNYQELMNAR